MDLNTIFVASVLAEGLPAVRRAAEKGVDGDCLKGKGLRAWVFVLDYVSKYQTTPDAAMVESKTGVMLPSPPANVPAEVWIDEVLNDRLHNAVGTQLGRIDALYNASQPHAAYAQFEDSVRELRRLGIGVSKTVSLPSLLPEFLAYYERLEAGETGILTPWPTVNEATLGFWPEDFVLYVARLGVGKSWTLIILADHAWAVQKRRVLFVTTEMGRQKILQRWVSVHKKYPYNELRRARLGSFVKQKMMEWIDEVVSAEGLYIIGGDFDFRVESLEAAIEESEPDIVFLDGAYLLKVPGDGRTERAANSFDELKRMAKRNHIPLVASTQFNREVKGSKLSSAGPEKIALSDAAGWNADLIFGLMRTDDMVRDKRMVQLPLKFREGLGEEVETHWDFDTMNFDELPKGAMAALGASGAGGAVGSSGGGAGSGAAPGSGPDPDPYGAGLLFGGSDDTKDVPF